MKLIADLHCHTVASTHAYSTLEENARQAAKMGLDAIAITDHGPTMPDAPHKWHFANWRIIPDYLEGVRIFKGIESNIISANGDLDREIDDDILRQMDWVIASFHLEAFSPASEEEHTRAYLKLLQNPYVDCLGHSGTWQYSFDQETVVKACGAAGKFMEINNNSFVVRKGSAENCRSIATLCKKYGTGIVVNTDAHFSHMIGQADRVCQMLRDIDFPEELILNANKQRLFKYIEETRRERF